nr:hypothetical protein [Tanacetum cinerariifolium]
IRRRRYNLIPAESKFKNLVLDHQDKFLMKAQVHVSKSSTISDRQALPRRKRYYQTYQMIRSTSADKPHKWCQVVKHILRGRLLESFQDLEHEGGDTRIARRKHYFQIYQVVKHMLRGRLLESFLDHEHEGGDTRSQGCLKDNVLKIKIQDHVMQMILQMNSQDLKAQSFKKFAFE